MAYIGKTPTSVPLTSSDITDGIISTAKIADNAISAAKLASGVGGKVLQVVAATKTGSTNVASTSLADIGLSAAITPTATSSKIFMVASLSGRLYTEGTSDVVHTFAFIKGSTTVYTKGTEGIQGALGGGGVFTLPILDLSFVDSPNTTDATTYKVQVKANTTANGAKITATSTCHLTLMEIAG